MRAITPLSLIAALAVITASPVFANPLSVGVNETTSLRLRAPAAGVVIGNPAVADVAVHDAQLLFLTGKSFGNTNIMVVDANGYQIFTSDIVVVDNTPNRLTVTRGSGNETYSCSPQCQAAPRAGDSAEFFGLIQEQNEAAREAAAPAN